MLDRFGVHWSGSKTSRVVRAYVRTVQGNGFAFADYVANQVVLSEHQRRVVADELRKVTAYVDPTGESAVNNVVRAPRQERRPEPPATTPLGSTLILPHPLWT